MVGSRDSIVTIYESLYKTDAPKYITVAKALERIGSGKHETLIAGVRNGTANKKQLPCVSFSGKFSKREDAALIQHSGFVCLDFDKMDDLLARRFELEQNEYVYALWLSPSGFGLKALIKIADPSKHAEHYKALLEDFPDADKQTSDISRLCFESYDPDIYVNEESKVYDRVKKEEKVEVREVVSNDSVIFGNIVTWLTNRGDAFVTGERNVFIFKLASACCRFGINEDTCKSLAISNFEVNTNSFSIGECERTIRSAYKANKHLFATAEFDRGQLVDKVTRGVVDTKIDPDVYDENVRPKDVIFGEDVREDALGIYDNGYEKLKGIGVEEVDKHFKMKVGEITLLSGIGNYGKSSYWSWYLLMRCIKHDERFAIFSPEENPAHEFYLGLTEMLLGSDCVFDRIGRPDREIFKRAYDWVSDHIFFVYPKTVAPTPDYIKERFLELVIKKKVNGVVIDPFNQLSNDYGKSGGRSDKYLETFLSDCTRFAQTNGVYFNIIAHPKQMHKDATGNYPCPDVFDIADGAMWNNKMDNILIYHRPNHQTDPDSPICELHSKKIRRQKTVGKKGWFEFQYARKTRRYMFNGEDPMENAIREAGLNFYVKKSKASEVMNSVAWSGNYDDIPF